MMKKQLICLVLLLATGLTRAQSDPKSGQYFAQPIVTDSSSTIFLPTAYDASLFSSNKLTTWGGYYANIIVYNFVDDSRRMLFPSDTYIVRFEPGGFSHPRERNGPQGLTRKWMFYRVMNADHNRNGRIDADDPCILYVSDLHGDHLKALTTEAENVVELQVYEKQNIALVKLQRDATGDGNFSAKDNDFYYLRLNLNTLSFGQKIELKH